MGKQVKFKTMDYRVPSLKLIIFSTGVGVRYGAAGGLVQLAVENLSCYAREISTIVVGGNRCS